MEGNRTKKGDASDPIEYACDTCGSRFRTEEALEVHSGKSHVAYGNAALQPNEALSYAPGGTVADFETGPKPGGKMDRETSRPAKHWETPGEGGERRRGLRNEGVAPIELPEGASAKKNRKKSADDR
jgi:hypothetical protein